MAIGWRRPIRCLKLQVIFRKRATNYRALLRKITYEDKAPYVSAPPCIPCAPRQKHLTASNLDIHLSLAFMYHYLSFCTVISLVKHLTTITREMTVQKER